MSIGSRPGGLPDVSTDARMPKSAARGGGAMGSPLPSADRARLSVEVCGVGPHPAGAASRTCCRERPASAPGAEGTPHSRVNGVASQNCSSRSGRSRSPGAMNIEDATLNLSADGRGGFRVRRGAGIALLAPYVSGTCILHVTDATIRPGCDVDNITGEWKTADQTPGGGHMSALQRWRCLAIPTSNFDRGGTATVGYRGIATERHKQVDNAVPSCVLLVTTHSRGL